MKTNKRNRTDTPIATVHAASADDVDQAVKAARAALAHSSWKQLPPTDRGRLMAKLADLIEEKQELFASIDAWDNGAFTMHLTYLDDTNNSK